MLSDVVYVLSQQSPTPSPTMAPNPDAGGWPIWFALPLLGVKVAPMLVVGLLALGLWYRADTGWELTAVTAAGIPLVTVCIEIALIILVLGQPQEGFLLFYTGLAAVTGGAVVGGAATKAGRTRDMTLAGGAVIVAFGLTLSQSPSLMHSILVAVSALGALGIGHVTAQPHEPTTTPHEPTTTRV